MGTVKNIAYYAFHPVELRAIIQWCVAQTISDLYA